MLATMSVTVGLPRVSGPGSGSGGPWKVVVLNDNHNTFDHVAETLASVLPTVALADGYRVPAVRVKVLLQRPADDYGELHGLYEPEEDGARACITVWMRTAQKKQVVAFKTFLRTLIHEVCHHLDYELFALEETLHTEGFYKRESSLVSELLVQFAAQSQRDL